MENNKLIKLPNNDNFAQCCRSIYKSSFSQHANKRRDEIINCNHLFLKLKEKEYVGSFHSSDCEDEPSILECVHCGLTNKFEPVERVLSKYRRLSNKSLETIMFHQLYHDAWKRGGKSFDDYVFNLISDGVISTNQAGLLYKLALIINPKGSNEELFDIMNSLDELENDLEKWKLSKVEQCADLIDRYNKRKIKVLKYAKK